MARRSGTADLPLHGGHVPKWLADRMTRLRAVISEAIVHHYGRDELLRRLAHPFRFQSFGAVMGMDWHSSGITTSVIGAAEAWAYAPWRRAWGPSIEMTMHVGAHSDALALSASATTCTYSLRWIVVASHPTQPIRDSCVMTA
jgi:hypothetical protein